MYTGKRLSQEELDALLDTLKDTEIGTRKDYQWARSQKMYYQNNDKKLVEEGLKKRSANPTWRASRGQQHESNSTKVKVYKGTRVGNARWGTLDLIDEEYFGTFNSLGDAAKATGMTKAAVSSCINGKIRFSKEYRFEKI